MRSRYSAYALGLVDYIIDTTLPAGPHWQADRAAWASELKSYCQQTKFLGLTVLSAPPPESLGKGRVHFLARLRGSGRESLQEEESRFIRLGGRWLYER